MALDDASGWSYVKQIDITNPSGAYQMDIWIHSGSGTDDESGGHLYCNTNCDDWPNDIRFGTTNDPDTATQLDTWYESGTSIAAPSSHIWIETPATAAPCA